MHAGKLIINANITTVIAISLFIITPLIQYAILTVFYIKQANYIPFIAEVNNIAANDRIRTLPVVSSFKFR